MHRLVLVTATAAGPRACVRPAAVAAGRGREQPVKDLLETHLPHVYRFALQFVRDHHLAEDVAHDTMLRAWRHRGRLRDERAGRVWLLRITANLCRDHLRRKRRRGRDETLEAEPPAGGGEGRAVGAAMAHREDIARVLEEMDRLSPRRRRVLFLHAFEQLSHDEIAEVLGMTKGAVATTLAHARAILRDRLSDIDPKGNGRQR